MATKAKKSSKTKTEERAPYLTKRLLVSAAKRGIRKAAEETMQIMGYNVIARDGWVVKLFPDGSIERITQIEQVKTRRIALD